jgi:hypothetical protein
MKKQVNASSYTISRGTTQERRSSQGHAGRGMLVFVLAAIQPRPEPN